MKRKKKLLVSLFMSMMLVMGLIPAVAAAETTEPAPDSFGFRVVSTVQQGGTAAPGEADFRFILSDKDGNTPADYGITMQDIKIRTNGEGDFYQDVTATIDPAKVTTENGWTKTLTSDPGDGGYACGFVLSEKNDGAEGWKYSEKEYTVRVRCDKNQGTAMVAIWIPGTDVEEVPAFTNTFTKDAAAAKTDKNSPKTGDDSNIGLWAVMLLVSGGVITGAIVTNRRKHSAR